MPNNKPSVVKDARTRAGQTLSDGSSIMDKALLLRCADAIDALKKVLEDIAENAHSRGGIWAKQRAERALDDSG